MLARERERWFSSTVASWTVPAGRPSTTFCGGLGGKISEPAWRSKPSWYLVTTEDKMIPPSAQRSMAERAGSTVAETSGSHAVFLSQPTVVAELIKDAAAGLNLATR